jgi:hypothetical protein
MKKIIILMAVFLGNLAQAHEFKTANVCSKKTPDLCGHIGYDKIPSKKEKFDFTFDVVDKKKAKLIKDVKIQTCSLDARGQKEYYSTTWTLRPDGHHWDVKMDQVPNDKIVGVHMSYQLNGQQEDLVVDVK